MARTPTKDHHSCKTKGGSSDSKGRLLERIAALLHEGSNADVEIRAKPPPLDGPSDRREIDVLLSGQLAGYPVSFAIECRNWKKRMGPAEIDGFAGKLEDIGIPTRHGIFISANGYTKGAIRRAKKAGIRPLLLQGLTEDRLSSALTDALQTTIFLLPVVASMTLFDEAARDKAPRSAIEATVKTVPQDLPGLVPVMNQLWELWTTGVVPTNVGEHHCFLRLPTRFQVFRTEPVLRNGVLIATIQVQAVVFALTGQASVLSLINADTQRLERATLRAEFPDLSGQKTSVVFKTEEEVAAYLQANPNQQLLVGRVKVPRLVFQSTYWPPSQQALARFRRLKSQGKEIDFRTVESLDLGRAWELFQSPTTPTTGSSAESKASS